MMQWFERIGFISRPPQRSAARSSRCRPGREDKTREVPTTPFTRLIANDFESSDSRPEPRRNFETPGETST